MIGLSSDDTMTSSDMPKNYEVIVISDDDDEVVPAPQPASQHALPEAKTVPEVKPAISDDDDEVVPAPQPAAQAAPEAKPVPEVKPTPKAKPAKRKRVSESTLNGWRDNYGCKFPQEYETCTCQDYRDFLE
jgi:hypothetical protein